MAGLMRAELMVSSDVYNQGNSQSVIDPSVNRQVPEFDLKGMWGSQALNYV